MRIPYTEYFVTTPENIIYIYQIFYIHKPTNLLYTYTRNFYRST